ncbi:MAG: hypothetical protein LBF97_08340 [Elusimicrobiota bacterium]|jgi:hypothetical protein|nr:hypothetical protein [Elusimicrobiota bacterium]
MKILINYVLFIVLLYNNFLFAFLKDFGLDEINYEKYGYFENLNTEYYRYVLLDEIGLCAVLGEGIYPNIWAIFSNPIYYEKERQGLLHGIRWHFLEMDDLSLIYCKWAASSQEDYPTIQFYIAEIFEKAGYIKQAIKAYYSILVFFPNATLNIYEDEFIYLGEEALNRIKYLTNKYKKLKLEIVDAKIEIKNKFDKDKKNDIFYINPGRIVKQKNNIQTYRLADNSIQKEKIFQNKDIILRKYKSGHWQLLVNQVPFVIKAVLYSPIKIGDSINSDNYVDWTIDDENNNKKADAPFDMKFNNRNTGDFTLMRKMGLNTIVLDIEVEDTNILKLLFNKYMIRVIYKIYIDLNEYYNLDDNQIKLKLQNIIDKHKKEKYLFMWALSFFSENEYYSENDRDVDNYILIDKIANLFKSLDNNHPLIFANKKLYNLDIFETNNYLNNFDIFEIDTFNTFRGFGHSFWADLEEYINLPILVQYGFSSFENDTDDLDRKLISYHKNSWEDIEANLYGYGRGICIGGIIFEWVDNWWRIGKPNKQEKILNKNKYDDFFGMCIQKDIMRREVKDSYLFYKEKWREFKYV